MWKAVRNGDPGGYAYLAWMHHNGHIGGHLPRDLQPRLPDGGAKDDKHAANKRPGWKPGPRSESELRETAATVWGEERLSRSNSGRGVGDEEEQGQGSPGKRGGAGGGSGGGRRRRRGEGENQGNDGDFGEYFEGEEDEYGDYVGDYGYDDDGRGGGEREGGVSGGFMGPGDARPLRPGEDVWGGMPSEESWPWETIGGGVSGAIAAADLYLEGFRVSRGVLAGLRTGVCV